MEKIRIFVPTHAVVSCQRLEVSSTLNSPMPSSGKLHGRLKIRGIGNQIHFSRDDSPTTFFLPGFQRQVDDIDTSLAAITHEFHLFNNPTLLVF
jgi:hypothetical protein